MGRHIATVWSRDMSLVHVLHCQFNLIRMVCGHICSLSYVIDQVIELHFLFKVISEQGKYGVCALHIPQYVNCMCTTVCELHVYHSMYTAMDTDTPHVHCSDSFIYTGSLTVQPSSS